MAETPVTPVPNELTDSEREHLRALTYCCLDHHKNELQRLAQRLLCQEAEKSLRLAKLSTKQDEAFIALKKQLDTAEGHIREIPKYFRCVRCGAAPALDGTWRWLGPVPYEHKCPDVDPQCGYFPVRLIQRGEDGAGEPKVKRSMEYNPLFRAILSGLAAGVGAALVERPELTGPLRDPLTPEERQFLSDCCVSCNGMNREVRDVVRKLLHGTSLQ